MNRNNQILADFAIGVRASAMGYRDIRAAANTYSAESGGFAVSPDFVSDIFMRGEGALLPLCSVIPVTSGSIGVPVDGTAPWDADGIQAVWIDEEDVPAESLPGLSLNQFRLKKLVVLVPVTEELVEDSAALAAWLPGAMNRAATWKINNAIISGGGAGSALGVLSADATIEVEKESGQTAGTIVAANVAKMMARCLDLAGATWIANPDAYTQVVQLGLFDAPTRTLAGLPIVLFEGCPALGSRGDLILGNLSGYQVASKNADLSQSAHLWFDRDIRAFKLTFRMDGQPALGEPTTPPNSSNTRSHFVVLQVRG